jgi:hypothetical protein
MVYGNETECELNNKIINIEEDNLLNKKNLLSKEERFDKVNDDQNLEIYSINSNKKNYFRLKEKDVKDLDCNLVEFNENINKKYI